MKLNWNRKYTTISMYVFLTAAAIILFLTAIIYRQNIFATLSSLFYILRPVIYGIIVAYLLIPMDDFLMALFKKISPNEKDKKALHILFRTVSVLLSYIIFLGLITSFVLIVIPDAVISVKNISDNLSYYFQKAVNYINRVDIPYIDIPKQILDTSDLFDNAYNVAEKILPSIYTFFQGFFSEIVNFVIGLLISLYIITGRAKAKVVAKKALQAFMEDENADKVSGYCKYASHTFGRYISGMIIDSMIVGVVCYIILLIMRIPNPALISLWVGITNIVPIFGPFVGAIPSAAIILLTAPEKTLLFIAFIFILQQLDGYVIKPIILGDSMGIPAFWVVVSLLVFGGFFGIFGLLMAVPIAALIYDALKKYAKHCLAEKNAANASKKKVSEPVEE
ncbi:MAG: AI-2E family transporter [Ruminococcaceae bacterium]|nr:AI-2E family transporter [Oscillospiraceae bacterium]